jgi:hypothetical protein
MILKICTVCKISKSLDEYYSEKRAVDGKTARCKKCHNKLTAQYRNENKEKYQAITKKWKQANKERALELNRESYIRCRSKRLEDGKKWRLNNKELRRYYRANRRATKKQATVIWADKDKIKGYYRIARFLTELNPNEPYEVDHIVPLVHTSICGLHCDDNLQVIPQIENRRKSNKFVQ